MYDNDYEMRMTMPALPLHMCFAIELSKKYKGLTPYPLMVGAILPDCLYPGDTKSFRASHCLSGSAFQAEKIIQRFGDVVRHPEDWALMIGWHSHVWLDAYDSKRGLKLLGKKKIHESETSRMRFYDNLCDYAQDPILGVVEDMVRVPTPMVTVLEQMLNIRFKHPQEQLRSVLKYIERRSEMEPDERRPLVRSEIFDKYLAEALEDYPFEELGLRPLESFKEEQLDDEQEAEAVLDPAYSEYDQLDQELDDLLKMP